MRLGRINDGNGIRHHPLAVAQIVATTTASASDANVAAAANALFRSCVAMGGTRTICSGGRCGRRRRGRCRCVKEDTDSKWHKTLRAVVQFHLLYPVARNRRARTTR